MFIRRMLNVGLLAVLLVLTSCGVDNKTTNDDQKNPEIIETQNTGDDKIDDQITDDLVNESSKSDSQDNSLKGDRISQTGAYGMISLTVPEQWGYKTCAVDETGLSMGGDYGIIIYPKDNGENGGHIEIAYSSFFGVCGTGLEAQELTLGGDKADVGYYDGSKIWDYVCYKGKNEGIVAYTYDVDKWWDEYSDDVMKILDTLEFEPDKAKGAIGVYENDSDDAEISLNVSVKNITEKSAVIVFNQYEDEGFNQNDENNTNKAELSFGEDFAVQRKNADGAYEAVPVVIDGEWGINDIAHVIEKSATTEYEYDWGWLYGELQPGDYRIQVHISEQEEGKKSIDHFVYAYFLMR